MFEVQCPSCQASYQVDERRVPPSGLKMRCPKCGDSFQVETPAAAPPVLGAALGLGGDNAQSAAPQKATMLGIAVDAAAPIEVEKKTPPTNSLSGRTIRNSDPLELAAIDEAEQSNTLDELEADLGRQRPGELVDDLPVPSVRHRSQPPEIQLPGQDDAPGSSTEQGVRIGLMSELPSLGDGSGDDLPSISEQDDELDLPIAGEALGLPVAGKTGELGSIEDGQAGLPMLGEELDLPSPGSDLGLPVVGEELDLPSPDIGLDLPGVTEGFEEHSFGSDLPEASDELGLPLSSGSGLSELAHEGTVESEPLPSVPNSSASMELISSSQQEIELPSLESLEALSGSSPAKEKPDSEQKDLEDFDSIATDFKEFEADSQKLPSLFPELGEGAQDSGQPLAPPRPPRPPNSSGAQPDAEPFDELSPAPQSAVSPQSFGEVDFSGPPSAEEFDAFPTESAPHSAQGGPASTEYGDINLAGGDDSLDLGEEVAREEASERPMAGAPAAASAAVERPSVSGSAKKSGQKTGLSRRLQFTIISAFIFVAAGGALTFDPQIGAFGSHYLIDRLNESDYESELRLDRKLSLARLSKDSPSEAEGAFLKVLRKQSSAPRFAPRKAYAAFLGYWRDLRFGGDTNLGAKAKVLIDELKESHGSEVQFLNLAVAAQKLAGSQVADVTKRAQSMQGRGPEYAAIVGEAALKANNPELALQAFASLVEQMGKETPLSLFGKARSQALLQNDAEALKVSEEVLVLNPQHVGASLLVVEIELANATMDEELVERLLPVTQEASEVSSGQRVRALNLLGQLHLNRGRIKAGEEVFEAALKIDRGNAKAQRGLAEALLASGLFSEALAYFESALKRAPNDLAVELGLINTQLELESFDAATQRLEALRKLHAESTPIAYFSGKVAEKLDKRSEAQAFYESAIKVAQDTPELVMSYIALTRLHAQQGENVKAEEVISEAREKFPDNAVIFNELAELALERGAFEEAIRKFDRALELDSRNLAFQFSRGIALRQAGRFDEAQAAFAALEVASKDYPGLALEKGNLYEASGRTDEALKSYEAALAVAPEDLDMMLRVGCARALLGSGKGATQLLQKVFKERPNSAEVNFCFGVSLLNDNNDLQKVRRHLQRAADADPTRARHHYYLGVILAQTGASREAMSSLNEALKIDQTMADALWRRGELKVKLGQIVDAKDDLLSALALAPDRKEAHASLALAYMGMGKEQDAINEWSQAITAQKVKPEWFYFYGKLLVDNSRLKEAINPLQRGVELVPLDSEKLNPWIYDAHRYLALALGEQEKAIPHWNKFLSNRPDSPYAPQGLQVLKRLSR